LLAPDGEKLLHAELVMFGHRLFVCEEFSASEGGTCRCPRTLGGTGVRLSVEVDDAERTVERAVAAGATAGPTCLPAAGVASCGPDRPNADSDDRFHVTAPHLPALHHSRARYL
jgi:hypothetical protein